MRPLNILIDARLGWGSGIGRFVANTVPRVVDLMPHARFDIAVLSGDAPRAAAIAAARANLTVREIDAAPFSLAEQRVLPGVARDYDLTWFTNYFVPLLVRSRFVANVHDMIHQEPALFPANAVKRHLSHRAFGHVAARASGVFYLSRFTQRAFEGRYGRPQRPQVVSCGVDHDDWEVFDPDAPPPKKRQLLIVAAAKQHKNSAMAINAFKRARIEDGWTLKIITPNDKLRSSIDLSGAAGTADRVSFAQGLSNQALRTLYGETAIVLNPSCYEGFGLSLVEGLQAGAQCIASTAAALVEVGLGSDVTYVPPDDLEGWTFAIERECARFDAGDVLPTTVTANMRHALQYRWKSVAERTVEVLNDVTK